MRLRVFCQYRGMDNATKPLSPEREAANIAAAVAYQNTLTKAGTVRKGK